MWKKYDFVYKPLFTLSNLRWKICNFFSSPRHLRRKTRASSHSQQYFILTTSDKLCTVPFHSSFSSSAMHLKRTSLTPHSGARWLYYCLTVAVVYIGRSQVSTFTVLPQACHGRRINTGPFRIHGFGFGFGFRLRSLVWCPEHVRKAHATLSTQLRGQASLSRVWSRSRGFEKGHR